MRKAEDYVRKLLIYIHRLETRKHDGSEDATDDLLDLSTAITKAVLTDKQKEVLRLLFIEDFTQGEVGLKLVTSDRNIRYHLRSATKKLADVYEEWHELEEKERMELEWLKRTDQ